MLSKFRHRFSRKKNHSLKTVCVNFHRCAVCYVRIWIRERKIDFIDSIFVLAYHHQTKTLHCQPKNIFLFNTDMLLSQWQLMDILVYSWREVSAWFIAKNQFWHFQMCTYTTRFYTREERGNFGIVLTVDQYAHSYHYANRSAYILPSCLQSFSYMSMS